jgi:hypothetical protein
VTPASAIASEARKFSLARSAAPTPRTSGEPVARADDAVRLVAADDGDRVGAAQPRQRALDGVEQVAVVEVVDQVRDDLGVGLRLEDVALRLELGAQVVVVLDDPVVDEADAARPRDPRGLAGLGGIVDLALARSMREVRVCVVDERRAVRRPARVRDPRRPLDALGSDVHGELGDACRAARSPQAAVLVDGDATRSRSRGTRAAAGLRRAPRRCCGR